MNTLSIRFQNCFGIGELNKDFSGLSQRPMVLIYAPNGTMKTSFANTFNCIAQGESPHDGIYEGVETYCDVKMDNDVIPPEDIFVVDPEKDYNNAGESVSRFLASTELKNRYDVIRENLRQLTGLLEDELCQASQSSTCLDAIKEAFGTGRDDENVFNVLCSIRSLLGRNEQFGFKYEDVFDSGGKVATFVSTYRADLQEYIDAYEELLNSSILFKQVDGVAFGTDRVKKILDAIEGNEFFIVGHRIRLAGRETEVASVEDFKTIATEEHNRILQSAQLRAKFDKIEKALNKNKEIRRFKEVLTRDQTLIGRLVNYEQFRKDVLISYVDAAREKYDLVIREYESKAAELRQLVREAGTEQTRWKEVVKKFNERFHVPFEIRIENQRDVLLKSEVATLAYYYHDDGSRPVKLQVEKLKGVLSNGERRALHILQFMFEVNARKLSPRESVIVLDDISDSFDYQNKFAIIEYLKDELHDSKFYILILTHNFDFYRTVRSRVGNSVVQCYMARRQKPSREICISEGRYLFDVFEHWISSCAGNRRMALALIPFVRNVCAYVNGKTSIGYRQLTACLHYKVRAAEEIKATHDVVISDVVKILTECVKRLEDRHDELVEILGGNSAMYLDALFDEAEAMFGDEGLDPVCLENKVVFALAIRMKAEQYIVKRPEYLEAPPMYDGNQFDKLIRQFKQDFPMSSNDIDILNRVVLITPEQIHLNSFLYEPLVDMGIEDFVDLYGKVKTLGTR